MAIVSPKTSRFVESEGAARLYKPAPSPLILTHSSTCFKYSCLGDISLLPLLLSAISIASTARIVLARAGLRNHCPLKVLHGIAGQSSFWGASWRDCSQGSRTTTSSTSWWPQRLHPGAQNNYFVYFLVVVHGTALRTSSCINIVWLLQARLVE